MAKKSESSRIPSAVGSIPVVGELVRSADAQARWMQEVVEQNARLVGQFPATMKSFNDTLERFNQTIGRLDNAVTQLERTSKNLTGPLERVASTLDPKTLREIPDVLESLRTSLTNEAIPALKAATDTQRQVALLQTTIDRILAIASDMPGAGILRRVAAGRVDALEGGADADVTARPRPRRRTPRTP